MSSWLPRLPRSLPTFPNISHLNPTPQFPPHTGSHCVGSSDIEFAASSLPESVEPPAIRPDTIAFRLFYPCSPSVRQKSSKDLHDKIYWIQDPQHSTVSAYARFLGATPAIANLLSVFPQLLYHIRIQAYRDAPLADLALSSSGSPSQDGSFTSADRWPVLVFSHGLGGSRNAYSHLCACLASHGIVVIAVDHRDGSQPVAYIRPSRSSEPEQREEMQSVDYQKISHTASPHVFEARDQQLKVRLWECSVIVELLACLDQDKLPSSLQDLPPTPTKQVFEQLRGKLDVRPGSITFAGHSFGAATTVQLLKSAFYSKARFLNTPIFTLSPHCKAEPAILKQIIPSTPCVLFDLWTLPLLSPATIDLAAQPLPCFFHNEVWRPFGGSNTLAILSEAFVRWQANFSAVKKFLSQPPPSDAIAARKRPVHLFYPTSSAHLSQSDFGVLFPTLTKFLAKAEEPERTIKLNIWATVETMREAGIRSSPFDPDLVDSKDDMGAEGNSNAQQEDDEFVLIDRPWERVPSPAACETENGAQKKVADTKKILSRVPNTIRGWVHIDSSFSPRSSPTNGTLQSRHRKDWVPNESDYIAAEGKAQENAEEALGDDELRGAGSVSESMWETRSVLGGSSISAPASAMKHAREERQEGKGATKSSGKL